MATSTLDWINSLDGKVPRSPTIRATIRKRAMSKAVAARKQSGKYSNPNRRQYPVFVDIPAPQKPVTDRLLLPSDTHESEPCQGDELNPTEATVQTIAHRSKPAARRQHRLSRLPTATRIPGSPSSTGYEAMRICYDFDVLALSGFTDLHTGRATAQPLHEQPDRLHEILTCKQWSYFTYIPSRFGNTKCLDDAVCCVAARVRQWITNPGQPNRAVIELYAKAVKSLQAALNDPSQYILSDVLCATEVLAIFELLDSERLRYWIRHAAGAAALIKLRGPTGYQTGYEQALFIAQVGPIYTEAMLKASHCFLEEPAWQVTLQTVLLQRNLYLLSSGMILKIWGCISEIPGLYGLVRTALRDSQNLSAEKRHHILSRARDVRTRLMRLGAEENLSVTKSSGPVEYSFLPLKQTGTDMRYEILGVFATNLMKVERLIVCLDADFAVPMEAHVQQLAMQILDLEQLASRTNPRAVLLLAFKVLAAKGTLLTADEWREETRSRPPGAVMPEAVFERWIGYSCPQRIARESKGVFDHQWRYPDGEVPAFPDFCVVNT
ncbi:MAG: hypothetical protein Q9222_001403 [Ikaeria aurantiellina]